MTIFVWLKKLLALEPHQLIGGESRPYMRRWFLIPRNRWLNIYLHQFLRDDDDRALHDHPWWFVSLMVRGQYTEITENGSAGYMRRAPDIAFRSAEHRHRIVLGDGTCWTIVLTGPRVRDWGFWCPQGFVPWRQFTTPDGNDVGPGCGD